MSYEALRPGEILINDDTPEYVTHDVVIDGEPKRRGLVPRDYAAHPPGCYAGAPAWSVDMPLIPRAEWSERVRDMVATKSLLSDIRLRGNGGDRIPALDQNGQGFCWAYSSTGAVMMLRAAMNEPYVRLSAHAIGCMVKGFRDEGGWGAQSLEFIQSRGVPSVEFWTEKSMSRSNDRPETWANAALHKVTGAWVDLGSAVYNRSLTFDQHFTQLLCRKPVVADRNWWSHSTCDIDPVDGVSQWGRSRADSGKLLTLPEFELFWGVNTVTGGYAVRTLNSWSDGWSDRGMGVISGNRAVIDGGVSPWQTLPSAA